MLSVLQLQNISVHTSGENQVQGTATFTQSEKDGLKNVQINIFAKGQLAPELPNYSNGIATGYLRFARLEDAQGGKTTRVTFVLENFAPTTATIQKDVSNNALPLDSEDGELTF